MIFRDLPDLSGTVPEFPHAADRSRVSWYSTARALRHDDHDEVFRRVQAALEGNASESERQKWSALTYIALNVLGMLAKANAEDLLLEAPDIRDGTYQEALDELRDRSRLDLRLLDAVDRASGDGDLVLKAYPDGKGGSLLDTVDPSLVFRGEDYFSEYSDRNRDSRTTLAPFVATPFSDGDGHWFVHLEIHEPGEVVHRVYRWDVRFDGDRPTFADGGRLTRQVEASALLPDVEDYVTGVEMPTLWVLKNDQGPHEFWGASDFSKGLVALQDAINHHLSTLTEHGERLMAGGIVVLPSDARAEVLGMGMTGKQSGGGDFGRRPISENTLPTMRRRLLDIRFEDNTNQGVTRYVQESPQFEGAFKLLEVLLSGFEKASGLTIDRLLDNTNAPESGKAMRLSRQRDRRRVARKQLRYQADLQVAVQTALRLAGHTDAGLPSWTWGDPFPVTDEEEADIILKRVGNKQTMSVMTSLQRYDGLTEADAQAEVDRIATEQHTAGQTVFGLAPAVPSSFADETPAEEETTPPIVETGGAA